MVNIPGSSKRCKECQVRRVKCGLEQPNCARCLKSGIKCSGPRVGSIFIHRDGDNIQRLSDRKMLNNAIHNQHVDIATQSRRATRTVFSNAGSKDITAPLPMIASVGCSMDLYRSVVTDLWDATCTSVNSPEQNVGSPMSTSTRAILPLAFRNKTLDTALFAVSTMYVGKLKGDTKLQGLAMAAYPQALGRFRSELASGFGPEASQTSRKILAIAIALSLLFFEWLANGTNGEGYYFHLNGALDLIKDSGPDALESSVTRVAYIDLRTIALGEALKSRKKTFLASDQWIAITNKLSTNNYRQSLLDIVAHIPGLLERGDQLKLPRFAVGKDTKHQSRTSYSYFQNAQYFQVIEYFQECDTLIRKLYHWLKSLKEAEGGRLWWHSDETAANGNLQQEYLRNKGNYSPIIHFSNSWIPGVVIYYWSGLLELSATIFEIRQSFVHGTLYVACFDELGADSPSLSIEQDTLSELAVQICQTVIYLSSSLEGCTMSHIPIGLAENYFIRLLSTTYQRQLEEDFDPLTDYESACMGLSLCNKGLEILRTTLKS